MQFHAPSALLSFPSCVRVKGDQASHKKHRRPTDSTPRGAPKCPNPKIAEDTRTTCRKNEYKPTPNFPKSMVSNRKTVQYIFHSRLILRRYYERIAVHFQVAAICRLCDWPNERGDTMLQTGRPPRTTQGGTKTGIGSPIPSGKPARPGFRLRKGGIFAHAILRPAFA